MTAAARARGWVHRRRSTLLIAGGLVAAVLVLIVLGAAGVQTSDPHDPDNPGPDGGQALARVLADEGVEVRVARSAPALEELDTGPGTTVLVTSTDRLGASTIDRLLAVAAGATLVLAEPGPGTTEALGLTTEASGVRLQEARRAECDDARFDGLTLRVDRAVEYAGGPGCWPGDAGVLLLEADAGIFLLGAADALTNDQVLRADNAAVLLRLLGEDDRLVWYVPSLDDLVADDGVSLQTLLPPWIRPGLWLVAIAMLALIGWRGRRLGPLATEPLPVVVKAIETTRSRGRLYRKTGDRAHAASALRRAARSRLAEHLRTGSSARDPEAVIEDVARHLDRPVTEIRALLDTTAPIPTSDHDLITLAGQLAELDREVRRP